MGARALAAAVLAAGATALATHWDAREPTDAAPTLVQLQPGAGPAATRLLAARGATEVVPELRLYRLPTRRRRRCPAGATGALRRPLHRPRPPPGLARGRAARRRAARRRRVVARRDRDHGPRAAGAGRARHHRRFGHRRHPSGVRGPPRPDTAQHAGAGGCRGPARHRRGVGRRRARQRPRHRRHLPAGSAALLGRGQRRGPEAPDERDRRRNPGRRPAGARRGQPQPWRAGCRAADPPGGRRGGAPGRARRRGLRQQRPDRSGHVSRGLPSRAHRRSDRPRRCGRPLLEPVTLRRSRRSRRRHHHRVADQRERKPGGFPVEHRHELLRPTRGRRGSVGLDVTPRPRRAARRHADVRDHAALGHRPRPSRS